MDDTDPFNGLESQNIVQRKSCPFGDRYRMGWVSVPDASYGSIYVDSIYVYDIPVKVARTVDDQIYDGLANNVPENDSGRRSGNFCYSGTSGRVTVYYVIE